MEIKTHTEIINEIKNTDELQAIEIIINGQPTSTEVECSVILSDNLFSWGYETIYNNELVDKLQCCVRGKDIILIQFIDTELPKAWEQSYLLGGIPKERHDRRVKFHPYNEMNELFCVDANLSLHECRARVHDTPSTADA